MLASPPHRCAASFAFAVFIALVATCPAQGQTAVRATASEAPSFVPKVRPEVVIRRASGAIVVDGVLDDAGWQGAARVTGFTEIQPDDEVQPPVRTEVRLAYDDARLYVAFVAHDDPEAVRASLRNRDAIFQDDWVGLILDPYGDGVQAYEIFANPLGIQGDLFMSPGNEDPGFDLIYHTEGRLTEGGYVVEMAIPFSSLRFPDRPEQVWRLTFVRNHPRSSRGLYSWATVSRDDPCLLCQLGTVRGIEGIEPSTNLDVLPAVVGTQQATRTGAGRLDNQRVQLEPSVNLRYSFTPSLSAEATVNPDFSQVESDAAQIDVNTTFALFFPERRPFFQEGSDLFDTWIDAVYTRSINAPLAAAKLSGRVGGARVAFLRAVDERTPLLLPFEERSALVGAGRSASTILRARRSFGTNSFVGGTVTDRRLMGGGSGSLVSGDVQYQFLKNYRAEAQLALSHTAEPASDALSEGVGAGTFGSGARTAALDGERFSGWGTYLSLERNARHWNFDVDYRAYSPTFRAANGFVTRNAYHQLFMAQNVDFYPAWDFVEIVTPGVYAGRTFNFDGVEKGAEAGVRLMGRLTGQTFFFATAGVERERFRDAQFDGLRTWGMEVNSQFSEPLSAGFYVFGGRGIYRSELLEGRRMEAGARLTIKPAQRLLIEPSVNYASMTHPAADTTFFRGYVLRTRAGLQFTRELSLRLVVQYDDFREALSVEPLVAYRLNAFSTFYVGSTHGLGRFGEPGVRRFEQAGRQLFFKFQYLFQV